MPAHVRRGRRAHVVRVGPHAPLVSRVRSFKLMRIVDCCSPDTAQKRAPPARGVSGWRRAGAVLTAVGVALLPKCPACWSVYAGLSSLLGVSFVLDRALLLPLTAASLLVALGALGSLARRTRRYVPFAAAVASALAVSGAKFVLNDDRLTWLALLGLVAASLLVARAPRAALASELPEHAQAR